MVEGHDSRIQSTASQSGAAAAAARGPRRLPLTESQAWVDGFLAGVVGAAVIAVFFLALLGSFRQAVQLALDPIEPVSYVGLDLFKPSPYMV